MIEERILLDLGPLAAELDLPRRVPIRRESLERLRTSAGPDLEILRAELRDSIADDPALGRSLSHGIARLDKLAGAVALATPAPARGRRGIAVVGALLLVVGGAAAYFFLTQEDEPIAADAPSPTTTAEPAPTVPATTTSTATTTSQATTTTTVAVPMLTLPTVVGEQQGAIVVALEALGLVVVVERVDSYDDDAGVVLSIEPPEGTDLVAGDTVTLTVARRPEECNERSDQIPPAAFADVAGLGEEAADAIGWAVAVGLVADGPTFGPDDAMSRAAAVTVLHRYMCEPLTQGFAVSFSDVASDAFYADAVSWAASAGVVSGTTSTTFSPNDPITRAAFMTVVWRALGEPRSDADLPFTDVAEGAFYEPALRWAFGEGLISGTTPTTFAPDVPLSRITTIVLFSRIELGPDPLVG